MYLPFLDHLLGDLDTRLLHGNGRYKAQYLLPSQVDKLTHAVIRDLFDEFSFDIQADMDTFQRELNRWKIKWTMDDNGRTVVCLEQAIREANEDLYPSVRTCLEILLAMPVATATAERSFSTMRRVKTYLRSTMTTKRLSGLGLLNIYREREINAERVVDVFARRKERRLSLLFKV